MKTTLKLILIVFVIILGLSCNTKEKSKTNSQSGEISVVTLAEFKERSVNQTIIDVRTPEEFREGYIEDAVNIDFKNKSFLDQISKLNKNKPIFIYCRSGRRSSLASKEMIKLGFQEVYDLEGGIVNWIKNQHEIVK